MPPRTGERQRRAFTPNAASSSGLRPLYTRFISRSVSVRLAARLSQMGCRRRAFHTQQSEGQQTRSRRRPLGARNASVAPRSDRVRRPLAAEERRERAKPTQATVEGGRRRQIPSASLSPLRPLARARLARLADRPPVRLLAPPARSIRQRGPRRAAGCAPQHHPPLHERVADRSALGGNRRGRARYAAGGQADGVLGKHGHLNRAPCRGEQARVRDGRRQCA